MKGSSLKRMKFSSVYVEQIERCREGTKLLPAEGYSWIIQLCYVSLLSIAVFSTEDIPLFIYFNDSEKERDHF